MAYTPVFDVWKFATMYVPAIFRPDFGNTRLTAFVKVLSRPWQTRNNQYQLEYQEARQRLLRQPETYVIQELLNDTYDPTQRRIAIVNTPAAFVVQEPFNLTGAALNGLTEIVRQYTPAGTTFTVQFVP